MGATNLVPNGIFGTVVQNWYRSVVSGDVPYSEQKNVYKEYINVPFNAHPGATYARHVYKEYINVPFNAHPGAI
jgi:hypothetical protein